MSGRKKQYGDSEERLNSRPGRKQKNNGILFVETAIPALLHEATHYIVTE